MVNQWWKHQSFDLDIDPDFGNCIGCWKKDLPRLARIAAKAPKHFDWWQLMTDKHGHLNPRNTALKPPFNFYRGNLSPKDIIAIASLTQAQIKMFADEDISACSETCEAF
jgi:hypothetical protein